MNSSVTILSRPMFSYLSRQTCPLQTYLFSCIPIKCKRCLLFCRSGYTVCSCQRWMGDVWLFWGRSSPLSSFLFWQFFSVFAFLLMLRGKKKISCSAVCFFFLELFEQNVTLDCLVLFCLTLPSSFLRFSFPPLLLLSNLLFQSGQSDLSQWSSNQATTLITVSFSKHAPSHTRPGLISSHSHTCAQPIHE